jgi:aarF domain-containing kinase
MLALLSDPHPGNIFVLDNGNIGLIDFGQVKQISGRKRETLAKVMVALDDRKSDSNPEDLAIIGDLAIELGVELKEDAKPEAAAAIAMWLFDGTVESLPGGYDKGELSPNSPVKELSSFPQDLVLVGRSTILIKGLSSRLGIPWSLCAEWAPIARKVLDKNTSNVNLSRRTVRFHDVLKVLKTWGSEKILIVAKRLPSPIRRRWLSVMVKYLEGTVKGRRKS